MNELLEIEGGLNIFLNYFKKFSISKIGIKFASLELDTSKKQDSAKFLKLLNMEDIYKPLNAFKSIIKSHSLFIFIDELDTGWDNSKEAHNYIYGLFYAVNKLKKEKDINIFLSLRQDMYNNLPAIFSDAEKLRDDIEMLSWNRENLRALIGNRIKTFLNLKTPFPDAIECVFEENALDYIIDHSLYRPREVIQFCNKALRLFKQSPFLNLKHKGKITLEIIKTVENEFSCERFNEICEEYKFQYPNLREFLNLFEGSSEYFTLDGFKSSLEENCLIFVDKYSENLWIGKHLNRIKDIIKLLFQIGFIKIYISRFNDFYAFHELPFYNVKNIERIKIHELFSLALKLQPNGQG